MTAFAQQALAERARLALTDPGGEAEAIAPLDGVRARQILLDGAEREDEPRRRQTPPWRPGTRAPDGRDLLARLGTDPNRSRGVMRCPAHDDRSASLSWRLSDDGRALLHCFAGCTFAEILEAIR